MQKNLGKIILVAAIIVIGSAFFYFDLGQYLTLESLKNQRASFQEYYESNAALTILCFIGAYVAMAALSLPGATIMTLAGGALFGLGVGLVLVGPEVLVALISALSHFFISLLELTPQT